MTDAGISEGVIWRRQSFHTGLRDLPFEEAPITPVLSKNTMMSASWKPIWSSQYIASSSAMDSAQPMSQPWTTQPSVSRQPAYQFLNMKPTPQEVDASMCKFGSRHCLSIKDCVMVRLVKQSCHRFISLVTVQGV